MSRQFSLRVGNWSLPWIPGLVCLLLACPVSAGEPDVTVELYGLDSAQEDNVRAFLSLLQRAPTTPEQVRQLFRRGENEVREALQALGYYRPAIDSKLVNTGDAWLARFDVTPGTPVRVAQLEYAVIGPGADDPAFVRARTAVAPGVGDVFHHGRYAQMRRDLQVIAEERGYFDARFAASEVRVNPEAGTASIVLRFETGERYRFGEVEFFQDAFDEEFLRRFVEFSPGDPFLGSKMVRLQSLLVDSEYFDQVEVRTVRDEASELRVPVRVTLTPRKRNAYSGGVGYGTDTGARVTADWERRQVDRRGGRIRAALELSQTTQRLSASYERPLSHPTRDRFFLNATWQDENTESVDSQSLQVSAQRVTRLGSGWLQTLSLNFLDESSIVASEDETYLLFYPEARWTHRKAVGRVPVTRGWRASLRLLGGLPWLGSKAQFVQANAHVKYLHTVGESYRLLLRGDLGATTIDEVTDLPASLRFFAGGDNSVRGYAYQELGPLNDEGEVEGGKYLVVGSVEVQRRVRDKWSLVAFYDVGNALNALDDLSSELKQGVGAGVRWFSPVGPIGVDLAWAIDEDGAPVRLHVRMGPEL